jgi:hypothetical protein
MNRIKIYADEFPENVWRNYCDICNAPYNARVITINFKDCDVSYK